MSTRDDLVESGLTLFLEHGYSACGIHRIVQHAGVPKGSFYHFFPDGKEALALAVVERYAERSADHRKHQLLGSGDPLERLRAHFSGFADDFVRGGFRQGCLLGNLSIELADHRPPIRQALKRAFAAWHRDVAAVLTEARSAGLVSRALDPKAEARFLVHSWEGALLAMKTEKSRRPLDDFHRRVFDRLRQGA